jgi:hypothetical protein
MRKKITYTFTLIVLIIISCTKDKGAIIGQINDAFMYNLCIDTSGYRYYQNALFLPPAGGSPHGIFRLLFNAKAQTALDVQTGELPSNGTFPDSSVIVKEAFDAANGNRTLYAVMFKKNGAWLWGEYKPDGEIIYSVLKDAGVCTSCHNAAINDQVLTFDFH